MKRALITGITGQDGSYLYVSFDNRCQRPTEVDARIGDASRAGERLSWRPQTPVPQLTRLMVDCEIEPSQIPIIESAQAQLS